MNPHNSTKTITADEIQEWLLNYMTDELNLNLDEIDLQANFSEFGLDSSTAVILTGDLGEWLGYDLDPTLLLDYPNLKALVNHLSP